MRCRLQSITVEEICLRTLGKSGTYSSSVLSSAGKLFYVIIIIIAPLIIVSEDQWEDLECLYKA